MTKLAQWRTAAGLTRAQVQILLAANGFQVSTAALGRWERGERRPESWPLAEALAAVTNGAVDPADLYRDAGAGGAGPRAGGTPSRRRGGGEAGETAA